MSTRYKILRPFKYGAAFVKPGDPDLEPAANDGRDWGLLKRTGYVAEREVEPIPADAVAVTRDDDGNRYVATAEGQVPVMFDLDRALVLNADGKTLFDATTGVVRNVDGDVLYDPAASDDAPAADAAEPTISKSEDGSFVIDWNEKRLLVFDDAGKLRVRLGRVDETAGSEDSAPPAQPAGDEGSRPAPTETAADSEKPLGGEKNGDSGTDERATGFAALGEIENAPTERARAEVIEGEGGWFRIEAGGAKIGNSTRDRDEADRRAAEYNAREE